MSRKLKQKTMPPALASSNAAGKDKLKEFSNIFEVPQETTGAPLENAAKSPRETAALNVPTGGLAQAVNTTLDFIFAKSGKDRLTQAEKEILKEPLDQIQADYLPAVVNTAIDKSSPVIALLLACYLIYKSRFPKEEPKAEPATTTAGQAQPAQPQSSVMPDRPQEAAPNAQ